MAARRSMPAASRPGRLACCCASSSNSNSSSPKRRSRSSSRSRLSSSSQPAKRQQDQQQRRRPQADLRGGSLRPQFDQIRDATSCADVWQLVQQFDKEAAAAGRGGVHNHVLSNALDTMKKKWACDGGSAADREAVAKLLQLGVERLGEFDPRAFTPFIRCAAAVKGLLQPEQLAAWQAVLQPSIVQQLEGQDVSNTLLSPDTLAEADRRLAPAVGAQLKGQLLKRAVQLATRGELAGLQDASNCLYGAALLPGRPPTAAQAEALLGAVQRAVERQPPPGARMYINVTQVLLACAKLADVQAEPGAAPAPGQDPFFLSYPDSSHPGLTDKLLRLAAFCKPPLDAYAASQIVGACGALPTCPRLMCGTSCWQVGLA